MPIICIALWLAPMVAMVPLAIEEGKKEKQINELCVQKFKTTKEIRECKDILLKVNK